MTSLRASAIERLIKIANVHLVLNDLGYIAAILISNPILLFRFILYFFLPVLCACPIFTPIIMAEHLKAPKRKIAEALLS